MRKMVNEIYPHTTNTTTTKKPHYVKKWGFLVDFIHQCKFSKCLARAQHDDDDDDDDANNDDIPPSQSTQHHGMALGSCTDEMS